MRILATAALAAAVIAPTPAHAWDPPTEVLDARYHTFRLTELRLRCRSDAIIPAAACSSLLEIPAYPDAGGGTRRLVPRPINPDAPADGVIAMLPLGKVADTVTFQAADLGVSYPISFGAKGTRVGRDLVRWEGITSLNFCAVQDFGSVIGRRLVRITEMGGNLCTRVLQSPAPRDAGATRFYKTFERVNDPACVSADATLTTASSRAAWGRSNRQNFVVVTAWNLTPAAEENTAYEAQLRAEQLQARGAGLPEPTSTTLLVGAARCATYAQTDPSDRTGQIPLVMSVEGAAGDIGRERVSPDVRNPIATLGLPEYVCRERFDESQPPAPTPLVGTALVRRPAVAAASADDEYELGLIPPTAFAIELTASPAAGVSIVPAAATFPLPVSGQWERRVVITLGTIAGQPVYNGPVTISLRSPTLGGELLASSTIRVVTNTRQPCEVRRHRVDRIPPYLDPGLFDERLLGRSPFVRVYEALARNKLALPELAPVKGAPANPR